jgi:hypothetical protein
MLKLMKNLKVSIGRNSRIVFVLIMCHSGDEAQEERIQRFEVKLNDCE